MTRPAEPAATPTDLITAPVVSGSTIAVTRHHWGFGGLHGGLALAIAARAIEDAGDLGPLRSVTGHYLRPMREALTVETTLLRRGRTASTIRAEVHSRGSLGLTATATFGDAAATTDADAPPIPDAGTPDEHEQFAPPPEFVPISVFTDIRPVGPNLPFFGGDDAELTAWIRLVDDDHPVDVPRLVLLADALAPSYAAVLRELAMIPTVELTVRPTGVLVGAASPWVLLQARSTASTADGWIQETIELWDVAGAHLGSAQQLRLLSTRSANAA